MKVLVTGASGLLGREILPRINLIPDMQAVGVWNHNEIQPGIQADLLDSEQCSLLMQNVNPDVLIHCAADRDPDSCERNPESAEKMNVGVLKDLLDAASPTTKFIFISSDYVFSGEHPPYFEDSITDPVNIYGRNKVDGEKLVSERADAIVLRVPLLIGAGATWEESGFIYKTCRAIQQGDPMELDDVGIRFPTWTRDVANFISCLIQKDGQGIYHFRGLRGNTKYGWACELAEKLGLPIEHIHPSEDPVSVAQRPKDTHLKMKRLEELGYSGIHDFLEVVDDVFETHSIRG